MPRESTMGRRSAVEWRRLLEEWQRSGQAKDVFARERGVVPSTFRWWATELGRRDTDWSSGCRSVLEDGRAEAVGEGGDVPA